MHDKLLSSPFLSLGLDSVDQHHGFPLGKVEPLDFLTPTARRCDTLSVAHPCSQSLQYIVSASPLQPEAVIHCQWLIPVARRCNLLSMAHPCSQMLEYIVSDSPLQPDAAIPCQWLTFWKCFIVSNSKYTKQILLNPHNKKNKWFLTFLTLWPFNTVPHL